jgi:leucyl/phenylalanyl-tRNA--protein transferase
MHAPTQQPDIIPADLLLLAYRSGIFPMSDHREDEDVFWVEPRERAIFPLDAFHISKSLRKVITRDRYSVTCDRAFEAVIAACAKPRELHAESWISRRIEASYLGLYHAGHAHSFECWDGSPEDGALVGGLYGVSFDRVFCGESMFSRADNTSKVALSALVAAMRMAGFTLLDCQFMTDHLASMGAKAIPQTEYLELLSAAKGSPNMSLTECWASFAQAPSPGKLIAQSLTQTS